MAPLLAEGTPEWSWLCAQDERIYIVEIDTDRHVRLQSLRADIIHYCDKYA